MNISLKYNDLCVKTWVQYKNTLSIFYNDQKLLPGTYTPFWIQCPHCKRNIQPLYIKSESFYICKQMRLLCCECSKHIHFFIRNDKVYDHKGEPLENTWVFERAQKHIYRNEDAMFKFRNGPVPGLWRRRTNLNKHGNSKKGLIFSSFRNSFDEQVYDYEADDINVINYKGKVQSIEILYNELNRHRPVRSWKRSKKRKQWM